ncbi:MAG TPA: hypothetical protein VEK05_01315 [Burkholderiales bacterium]|nr:hypothetical protein [Burkholderiales bacterium]
MSDPRSEVALRRILVAIEPPTLTEQPAVAAARELARSLRLELVGLFVESLDLLRLAALPIAREVGAASGAVRSIELTDVERSLRVQAEQVRGILSSLAAELDLPWSFRVERGDLLERVLAELSETAAAVFAPAPRKAHITPHGAAGATPPRRILTILDSTPAGMRAANAAQRLSLTSGAALSVAIVSKEETPLGPLAEKVAKSLPGLRGDTKCLRLADTSIDTLSEVARDTACDLLVLSTNAFPSERRAFRALLRRVRCPVAVVG